MKKFLEFDTDRKQEVINKIKGKKKRIAKAKMKDKKMKKFGEMIESVLDESYIQAGGRGASLQGGAAPEQFGKAEKNPKIKAYIEKGYRVDGKPQLAADGEQFIVTLVKDGKSIEVRI